MTLRIRAVAFQSIWRRAVALPILPQLVELGPAAPALEPPHPELGELVIGRQQGVTADLREVGKDAQGLGQRQAAGAHPGPQGRPGGDVAADDREVTALRRAHPVLDVGLPAGVQGQVRGQPAGGEFSRMEVVDGDP